MMRIRVLRRPSFPVTSADSPSDDGSPMMMGIGLRGYLTACEGKSRKNNRRATRMPIPLSNMIPYVHGAFSNQHDVAVYRSMKGR